MRASSEASPLVSLEAERSSPSLPEKTPKRKKLFACGLSVLGPGMLAALADADAACMLVAGDSGARYGYSTLITLQLLLGLPLFLAQELTVRLAVHTQKGHGA